MNYKLVVDENGPLTWKLLDQYASLLEAFESHELQEEAKAIRGALTAAQAAEPATSCERCAGRMVFGPGEKPLFRALDDIEADQMICVGCGSTLQICNDAKEGKREDRPGVKAHACCPDCKHEPHPVSSNGVIYRLMAAKDRGDISPALAIDAVAVIRRHIDAPTPPPSPVALVEALRIVHEKIMRDDIEDDDLREIRDVCQKALAHLGETSEREAPLVGMDEIRQRISRAYGFLWWTNNDPFVPMPSIDRDRAAVEARKVLRDLLTHEQRGIAINAVGKEYGLLEPDPPAPTSAPVGETGRKG